MKLYYSPGTCALAPDIVAHEMSLPLELAKVDLKNKRTETGEDFKKINANGYVPVLILDDGRQLTEVPAIVQYLADLRPETNLAPAAGSFERIRLQQWLNFVSTEIHKNFSPLFNSAMPAQAKELFKNLLNQRLDTVAEHLAAQPYLLGKQFTVADAYLYVALGWGKFVGIDISKWPVLERYHEKISARPSVQAAMREQGLV